MINHRNVLNIVIGVWFLVSVLYCAHTPHDYRTHDIWGHIPYTKVIVNEHRLPQPNEGWESFQPPLYYLINSLIAPETLNTNEIIHTNYVRALSVIYGAISLIIMFYLLQQATKDPMAQLLSLLFIATTPTFIFVFSTYNNDSLFTLLSIALVALSYKLYNNWSQKLALVLLIVSTAALYTKLMAAWAIATVVAFCCKNLLKLDLPNKNQIRLISVLLLSFALLLPWAVLHNHKYTGKLFPTNADSSMHEVFSYVQIKNLIGIVFKIPELQRQDIGFMTKVDYTHEWDDPWQHPNWDFLHPATKRFDYWGNVFVTSLIGEYIFEKPHVGFIWLMYFIHLLAHIFGLVEMRRSNLTKLAAFIILFAHFIQILNVPLFPELPQRAMAYRYICWTWMGWAVLYTNLLTNYKYSFIVNKMLIIGIAVQIYILMTVTGTAF